MIVETEKIIADIIAVNMRMEYLEPVLITLQSKNYITIYNQDFKIPNNNGLFACVEFLDSKVMANNNKSEDNDSGGIKEIQTAIVQEDIMIDLFSRSSESRQRKHEIILALNSIFSQQQQDKYSFRIFPIPSNLRNTSKAEGGSMLNRYSLAIKVQRCYIEDIIHNDSSSAYFDKFGVDVYDEPHLEQGIPLIHLEYIGEDS